MRRAAFFAGRVYTTRHLNAVRSPLLTGYINATGLSMTQCTFATNPVLSNGALAGSADALFPELPTLSEMIEGVLASTPMTQVPTGMQTWISLCGVRTTIRNMPIVSDQQLPEEGIAMLLGEEMTGNRIHA